MGKFRWEEFEEGPGEKTSDKIHATINKRRYLYLNERAFQAIGDPDAVVLMYDAYHQTIGVKASTIDKRNAFRPKRKDNRVGGCIVYAANFCRRYNIKPKSTLAFVRAEVDSDGVLILAMRETMSVGKK